MKQRNRAQLRALPMIDLNILPERYRKRKLTLTAARPWMFLLAYALLLIPIIRLFTEANLELKRVESDLASVQSSLAEYRPLAEEKEAIKAQIEEVIRQAGEIESATQSATIQEIVWSNVLNDILRIAPDGVEIAIVDISGHEMVIMGVAENHWLPISLADDLLESGLFTSVIVNALVQLNPPDPSAGETIEPAPPPEYEFEITLILGGEVESTP